MMLIIFTVQAPLEEESSALDVPLYGDHTTVLVIPEVAGGLSMWLFQDCFCVYVDARMCCLQCVLWLPELRFY